MRLLLPSLTVFLALVALAAPLAAGDGTSATFAAPLGRVWAATTAALEAEGWAIDDTQRPLGLILTKTSRLSGDDQLLVARSVRVRLRVHVAAAGPERTAVTVAREVLTRQRLLFVERDTGAGPRDPFLARDLERAVLVAIARAL